MKASRLQSDERLEIVISNLLRVGLLIASLIVLIGGAIYLFQHGTAVAEYGVFKGEPKELTNLKGVLSAAVNHKSRGIIQLGLFLLILTPIMRVVFSAVAYLVRKDYLYAGVTLFVLGLLIFNFLGT